MMIWAKIRMAVMVGAGILFTVGLGVMAAGPGQQGPGERRPSGKDVKGILMAAATGDAVKKAENKPPQTEQTPFPVPKLYTCGGWRPDHYWMWRRGVKLPGYVTGKFKNVKGWKEVYEGRRVILDEHTYPRAAGRIVEGPTIARDAENVRIGFALDKPDDVLVRIVDAEGKTVRNLACGVLGPNAPEPFRKNSLKQEILWNGKDTEGKPAPAGCKVCVGVGLTPKFDRFVAYDPAYGLTKHICGMEVDKKGRVYVTLFTERRVDHQIVRFDREGRYLDQVYFSNPANIKGKLEDVYPSCVYVDGRACPGQYAFHQYKAHGSEYSYYLRAPSIFRVDSNTGRACFYEINKAGIMYSFGYERRQGHNFFHVDPDRFWFLTDMFSTGYGVWALQGDFGYSYRRVGRGGKEEGVIQKFKIDWDAQGKKDYIHGGLCNDFGYDGREKLAETRSYIGTPKTTRAVNEDACYHLWRLYGAGKDKEPGDDERTLREVLDLAVDEAGNIYAADGPGLKIYRADGQFVKTIKQFEIGGKTQELGRPVGVRVGKGAFYVVARLDLDREKTKDTRGASGPSCAVWKRSQIVKFKLLSDGKVKTVWAQPLDAIAWHVAVDNHTSPPIVWVGNGGGPSTITRIVDEGDKPGEVRHIGGMKKGVLMSPWSVDLDAQGRIFVWDFFRHAMIRTNDDCSEWLERKGGMRGLRIDRKRGHLYVLEGTSGWGIRLNTDFKRVPLKGARDVRRGGRIPGCVNLGAAGNDGDFYVATRRRFDKKATREERALSGCISRFGPDGSLREKDFCKLFTMGGAFGMDSKGCIYVMDSCPGRTGQRSESVAKRGENGNIEIAQWAYLVKFAPGGGVRRSEAELWVHPGVSTLSGGCLGCGMNASGVAVDECDRIFAQDYSRYHVKVLDTAGNLITRVGGWGNADYRGPESKYPEPEIAFNWPHSLAVQKDSLYVTDRDLRRLVKIELAYREVKEGAIP